MSIAEIETTTVNVMGRGFKIRCPKNKIGELYKAAAYLDDKMQGIQRGNNSTTIDHVAITAALNISHELISEQHQLQSHTSNADKLSKRIADLKYKIDKALANQP